MSFKTIKFTQDAAAAIITLNRPEAANGLNIEMAKELAEAANLVASDDRIKVVTLTAEGRFFCAGGDVQSMYDESERAGDAVMDIAGPLHEAISAFSAMDAVLICAVNGTAAGAGFSLAVSADLVVASEAAKFTMAYSKIGLSPDGSSSFYLPRLIGLRRTQELMYTNRVLSAQEALEWSLVNFVVPVDDLSAKSEELAGVFASGSKHSNASIKRLLREQEHATLSSQLDLECQLIGACADGQDGKEGVASFIEKRKPTFK